MQHESSIFWPPRASHLVSTVPLDFPAGLPAGAATGIARVLKLADAMRDLQSIKLDESSRVFRQLRDQAADAMEQVVSHVDDPASRRNLQLRAAMLRGADRAATNVEIMQAHEQQLIGFCGPLATWLGKTRKLCYSAFFAVPNPALQALCDKADRVLHEAVAELRQRVDPGLQLTPVCQFQVTDLVAASGEANLHPKHFAYFLPEDEGVKHARQKRTVVFMNTYLALFTLIAREESGRLLQMPGDSLRHEATDRHLLGWFRGHDVGHSIMKPETEFAIASRADRWGSMQLQEVLADTFGLLLCTTTAWQQHLGLSRGDMCHVFMLEMLRYLRRAPCDFPDAGAAFIELQYLLQNHHATLDSRHRIVIDPDALVEGLTALARELSASVLENDIDKTMAFLKRYAPQYNPEGLHTLNDLLGESNHTLDYVQLLYQQTMVTGVWS